MAKYLQFWTYMDQPLDDYEAVLTCFMFSVFVCNLQAVWIWITPWLKLTCSCIWVKLHQRMSRFEVVYYVPNKFKQCWRMRITLFNCSSHFKHFLCVTFSLCQGCSFSGMPNSPAIAIRSKWLSCANSN